MIGAHWTTDIKFQRTNGHVEARRGFGMMGGTNMTEEQFEKCNRDPFHPEFYDNYVTGTGNTEAEAQLSLQAEMKSIIDSFWA